MITDLGRRAFLSSLAAMSAAAALGPRATRAQDASGQEANFLSGGEIPVPVASAGVAGGTTITIEWKEFGVKVRFVPTIVDTGVINLLVAPEVSSLDYGNAIEIFAEGKPLKKSVMGIVTDSTPPEAPKDPETRTPYLLYKLFATPEEVAELALRYRAGGMGDGTAKQMLLEKIEAYFGPFREKRKQLAADPSYVEDVLRDGAKRARVETEKTMAMVREATGLAH